MPGEHSRLCIFNGTSYRFKLTDLHSYQMSQFDSSFPPYIEPNTTHIANITYQNKPLDRSSDSAGDAVYSLEKDHLLTGATFTIKFRANSGYYGFVLFNDKLKIQGLRNEGKPRSVQPSIDDLIHLTWIIEGMMHFNLFDGIDPSTNAFTHETLTWEPQTAENGWFNLTGQPPNWMTRFYPSLKHKSFSQICVPGSHDSGMYFARETTKGVSTRNVVTQIYPVKHQLLFGARWFDLRPCIYKKKFVSGHYTYNSILGWLGGNGEDLESMIDDINAFTAQKNYNELIILRISHVYNIDNGFSQFSVNDWNQLLALLAKINYKLMNNFDYVKDLTTLPLSSFIADSPCVCIIIENPAPRIQPSYGFFNEDRWPVYNNYSESNDEKYVIKDQLMKLYYNNNNRPFAASWTSTQDTIQAILPSSKSIIELASEINEQLYKLVLSSAKSPSPHLSNDSGCDKNNSDQNFNDENSFEKGKIIAKIRTSKRLTDGPTIQLPSFYPSIVYIDIFSFNVMLYVIEINRLLGNLEVQPQYPYIPPYTYPYASLMPSPSASKDISRSLTVLCHNNMHHTKCDGIDWYEGIYALGATNVQYYQLKEQHYDFRVSITYSAVANIKDILYWLFCCALSAQEYPTEEYTSKQTSLPLCIPLTIWNKITDIHHLASIWKNKIKSAGGGDHTVVFVPIGCFNAFLQIFDNQVVIAAQDP